MHNDELNVIKQAILNEIEGYEFYNMAANQAGTDESKEAFIELANEELKHADYLRQLFDKVKNNSEDDFKLSFLVDPPSPNIFDWKKIDRKYTSLAISVFGIGIQMERASIDFYEDAKLNSNFEEAKKLYDILIGWEKVHLDQFTKQYNIYKEDWWNDQEFAPF